MTLASVTHRIPRQIIAGDTIEFLVKVRTEYQAWTCSARLVGPAQMDATSAVAEGDGFHVTFSGQIAGASGISRTAQLPAGQYMLTVWVKSGNDRVTVLQQPMTIAADLSAGAPTEPHCVLMLRLLETAIQNRISGNADGGIESYSIDGTTVNKLSTDELRRFRKQYAAEVSALQNPNGQFGRVKFGFTPTGGMVDVRRRFD